MQPAWIFFLARGAPRGPQYRLHQLQRANLKCRRTGFVNFGRFQLFKCRPTVPPVPATIRGGFSGRCVRYQLIDSAYQ
jgi:hypothetical protein